LQTPQSEVGAYERLLGGFGGLFLVAKSSAKVPQNRNLMARNQVAENLRVAVKAIAYALLICATH
jgi:small neutral amino acid transporter SnatA (MarC family)